MWLTLLLLCAKLRSHSQLPFWTSIFSFIYQSFDKVHRHIYCLPRAIGSQKPERSHTAKIFHMSDSPLTADEFSSRNTISSFEERVKQFKIDKSDINNLVINYLINEGYPKTAEAFSEEASVKVNLKDTSLANRVAIRNAILSGDIEDAIESLNDSHPTILDTNPKLHFSLLRLQLIEIVRNGDMTKKEDILHAIDFASKHLAPRATHDPEFVDELNHGMCLVVFNHDKLQPDVKRLLDTNLRLQIANDVNTAILKHCNESHLSQIQDVCRARQWAEVKCREMRKKIPSSIPLGLTNEESYSDGQGPVGLDMHSQYHHSRDDVNAMVQ